MSERAPSHAGSCTRYLAALFADAPPAAFIELRYRVADGMWREFFPVPEMESAERAISDHSAHTDVYIGVLPRQRRGGTRADVVGAGSTLWADCDTPQSIEALAEFLPRPSVTVASGSGDHCHAYWRLAEPVSLTMIEAANRGLAGMLNADTGCADAARVLRPPSLNHKTSPPRAVRLLTADVSQRHALSSIVASAPSPPMVQPFARSYDDDLLLLDPAVYVGELAGLSVPRHRKVRCPFHDDHTPSLHVYPEPEGGWYCFGCRRGGTVYDFAAQLWGVGTRGDDFLALRDALCLAFDHRSLTPS